MMKYPGPKDQHSRIERRYLTRLIIGIVIIAVGVLASAFNLVLSESTVLVPGADPGEGLIEIQAPFNANASVGMIALVVGAVINFYSINRYLAEYGEIEDKEPRPKGMFVGIGFLLTILALAMGGYSIFIITT